MLGSVGTWIHRPCVDQDSRGNSFPGQVPQKAPPWSDLIIVHSGQVLWPVLAKLKSLDWKCSPNVVSSIPLVLMKIINTTVIFSSASCKSGPELPPHYLIQPFQQLHQPSFSIKGLRLKEECCPESQHCQVLVSQDKHQPVVGGEGTGFQMRTPELGWHFHPCLGHISPGKLSFPL